MRQQVLLPELSMDLQTTVTRETFPPSSKPRFWRANNLDGSKNLVDWQHFCGAIHQNYRDRPSNDQGRNGQSRLQHQTLYLPAHDRRRMTGLSYARRLIRLNTQLRSG